MMVKVLTPLLLCFLIPLSHQTKYQPTWDSLDSRPLPEWYDDVKIGIFMHLGIYSVPAYASEWFWAGWKLPGHISERVNKYMKNNYKPDFTYQDFAKDLTMEFYNATEWIELFQRAGAKYAVLTAKHHEGYTLWPSKRSYSWNSMDVGPKRDVVGEFSSAVHATGGAMHLGLYHSLYEWFNPLYVEDAANNFSTRVFAETKSMPELNELVMNYKPDLIWSDGPHGPDDYWNSTGFLAWLYNDSPVKDTVVTNDRWAYGTSCKHGGYWNCRDRYHPTKRPTHKWENALTIDKTSWAARTNATIDELLTIKEIITSLVQTVANGGNFLLDVGPTKQGTIEPIEQERLVQMGDWLAVNGPAIYKTQYWKPRWNDTLTPDVYFTESKDGSVLNAIFLTWPPSGKISLGAVSYSTVSSIKLLGYNRQLRFQKCQQVADGITVTLPDMAKVQNLIVAWTLAIERKPSP